MRAWAVAGALLAACPAFAADERGNFSIEGAGILTCRIFLNERDLRSDVYYMIGGWLDGYVTSLNKHVAGTYDITSFESTELLTEVIFNHCKDHQDDRLYTVVNSIVIQLTPNRLQEQSPMVGVRVGDREGSLYAEVLRRTQQALEERGLLGAPSGTFDEETIRALRQFQSSVGFDPTGYPDQATLWRLLRE